MIHKFYSSLIGVTLIGFAGCTTAFIKPIQDHTFNQPELVVEQAALDALAFSGFFVATHYAHFLQGFRPRLVGGKWCNAGGETATIRLQESTPSTTTVWVTTELSSYGLLCQMDWTGELLSEIESSLSKEEQ